MFTLIGCLDPVAGDRDASRDVGVDTTVDTTVDTGVDVSPDAPDAGVADATVDGGLCGDRWPPRPTTDGIDSFYHIALKDIILDEGAAVPGWDLDQRCTVAGDDHRCAPPAAAAPPLDGPGGSDNAFGQNLLPLINATWPSFEANVRARMTQGETLFLRLDRWNHTPTDQRVKVEFYVATGVLGGAAPRWDGTDSWFRSNESPPISDTNAYVADGILVARIPDNQPIELPWVDGGRIHFRLTDARLTAKVDADRLRIEDVWIQGRISGAQLARAFDDAGICAGGDLRNRLDTEIARSLDVMSTPGTGGPGAVCDAMSITIALVGYNSAVNDIRVTPDPPPALVCHTP